MTLFLKPADSFRFAQVTATPTTSQSMLQRWNDYKKQVPGKGEKFTGFLSQLSSPELYDLESELTKARIPQLQKSKMLDAVTKRFMEVEDANTPQPEPEQPVQPEQQQPEQPAARTSPPAQTPPSNPSVGNPPLQEQGGTVNLQELVQQLQQTVKQFGDLYNQQARVYNPAISQILQSLRQTTQNPALQYVPDVTQNLQQLLTLLQQAVESETEDTGVMNQIAQLANQVANSISSNSQSQPNPGTARKPGMQPQTPPTPAQPAQPAQPGMAGNLGRGIGNFIGNAVNAPGNFLRNLQRGYRSTRNPQTASSSLRLITAADLIQQKRPV